MRPDLLPARAAGAGQLPGPSVRFDSAERRTPHEEEDDSLIDMSRVEGKVKASAVKKVEDIVNNYPDRNRLRHSQLDERRKHEPCASAKITAP